VNPPSRSMLVPLCIAAAAFLVFAGSLPNGLTLDDQAIIGENPLVRELTPLTRYLTTGWWAGQESGGYGDRLFRPLTLFSFGLQHALHGTAPFGYHLVNLALYALCLPLVFSLLRRLAGTRSGAVWGSLVFALHAVHSEAVVNAVGRAELLAFLFGATALWLHAREYRVFGHGRIVGLPLALAAFGLAAASKESGLFWLPVLLLWDLAATGEGNPWPKVRAALTRTYALYLLPAALYLWLRSEALGATAGASGPGSVYYPVNPLAWAETPVRILTGIKLLFYQQLLILLPFRLSSDYSFEAISLVRSFLDPWLLLALLAHGVMIIGMALAWRRARPLFFAAGFFYTTAMITSNIPLAIGTIFGERLLFTPTLALAAAVAWLLRHPGPLAGRRRVHATGLLALWLAASTVTVMARGPQWRDNRTLFLADLERQPRSVVLLLRAAEIHRDEGDTAQAEQLLLRSLEVLPEDPVALNNLGELHRLTGREREAGERLHQALRAAEAPHWAVASRNRALPCYNLGLLEIARGRPGEAIPWLNEAAAHTPGDLDMHDSLLQAALSGAPDQQFQQWLDRAEQHVPGHPLWRYYQGLFALYRQGDPAAAESQLAAALAADPEELRFHIALADLQAQTGRFAESMARYQVILNRFPLQPVQAAEIENRLRILQRTLREGGSHGR